MLSPGKYYQKVPHDLRKNYAFRLALLQRAKNDRAFQQGLMELCREDILFWISAFVVQHNPDHLGDEIGPFIPWDFQEDALRKLLTYIVEREDCRIEKSREMGATWICLLVIVWVCLFHKNKNFLLLSKDEKSVEKGGDPKALFFKIDKILEYLPDWMTGDKKRDIKKRSGSYNFMRTSSYITGEASVESAGVGGRYTAAFLDEFSQMKKAEELFDYTRDAAKCRIFNFTHVGTDTMAYTICYDERYKNSMKSIIMHWSQHPEKNKGLYSKNRLNNQIEYRNKKYRPPADFYPNLEGGPIGGPFPNLRSPWYDKEEKKRGERSTRMNLDIDPRGASTLFFHPETVATLIAEIPCRPANWIGELEYDKATGKPVKLVEKSNGRVKLWINPINGGKIVPMRCGAGADISSGFGKTPSCLTFIDCWTGSVVMEFVDNRIEPRDFAVMSVALCQHFGEVRLCWEVQGPGQAYGNTVMNLEWDRNVAIQRPTDVSGRIEQRVKRPGWNPTTKSILFEFELYKTALFERKITDPSRFAMEELPNWIYVDEGVEYKGKGKSDDPAGQGVHHGDVTVSRVLAYKMVRELGFDGPHEPDKPKLLTVFSLEGRRKMAEREMMAGSGHWAG